jgi:hypothetical protein
MKNRNFLYTVFLLFAACSNPSEKDYELLPVEIEERWGYIDQTGKYSINPQFKTAFLFSDGLAKVKDNSEEKFGFIDEKGKYVIPAKYVSATDFSDGIAPVTEEDQKITLINKEGTIITTLDSIETCRKFQNNYAAVQVNGKWGFINTNGEIVIKPQYLSCGDFNEGLAFAKIDSSETLFGFIDEKGNWAIKPTYSGASDFYNGIAKVEQKELWGYIDKEGNIIVNPQFDWATDFNDQYATVKLGEKWGYIDNSGKYVINPQFDWAGNFSGDLAQVEMEKKHGYINRKGEYVVNPQFDEATPFYDKVAFVKQGEKYGLINQEGKIIVNPQFFEKSGGWFSDFARVYGFSLFGGNSAQSDFFDSENIIAKLLADAKTNSFFGFTSSSTAQEILDKDSTLYQNSDNLYNYGYKINNDAEITKIKYYFKNDFVKYTKQYTTKVRYGYKFKEYAGTKKTVNYEVPLSRLYLELKLRREDKSEKFVEKLKEKLKGIYNDLKEETSYYGGLSLSNDEWSFKIYDNGKGEISLTVYY